MASVLKAPPLWQDEKLAKICPKCAGVFTLTNRKHHCRYCGKIYCKKCSSNSAPIPLFGIVEPVRVCDPCWDQNFSAKAVPKPIVSPIRIYYKGICREFDRNNVSVQSLSETFGATLSTSHAFDVKRGPFHLVKRDTREQFFYLGPGAPFWRILPQGEFDLLTDDQYQAQQRRRTMAMDVCMPDGPPSGNTSPSVPRPNGRGSNRGAPQPDEFGQDMAAMMADLEREEQKRRDSSPKKPLGPRKDAGRLAIGSREDFHRLSQGPGFAPPAPPDEAPATLPGLSPRQSPRGERNAPAPKAAVANHISDIKEIVGIMKDGVDKDAMRNQVKQVVQRRKTVLMQEALLVAAPVTVQEQLKPKREAMAESRKSRKTLLLKANADAATLAAEEEDFVRIERELQEEEERLLQEEEERVRLEFENLQRMEAEMSVAVSTGTSSSAMQRRKTRTVTMLLPPGVDINAMETRPAGGRARGESVAQRQRTAGEVKEQLKRGTARMSVKPRRETILELEGILATEKEKRRTMGPSERTKSVRLNDMLDEQEMSMLEEEVRLLREEEAIERAELASLQAEEQLVKEAERMFREEEAAFLEELAAEEERLFKEMLDEDAKLRDEEDLAARAEEAMIAAEEERLRKEEEDLLAAEEAALTVANVKAAAIEAEIAAAAERAAAEKAAAAANAALEKVAAAERAAHEKTVAAERAAAEKTAAAERAAAEKTAAAERAAAETTATSKIPSLALGSAAAAAGPTKLSPRTLPKAAPASATVTGTPAGADANKYRFIEAAPVIIAPTTTGVVKMPAKQAATPAIAKTPAAAPAVKVNRFPSGPAPGQMASSPVAPSSIPVAPASAPVTPTVSPPTSTSTSPLTATAKPAALARGGSNPTIQTTPPPVAASPPTSASPLKPLARVMPKIAPPPPPPEEDGPADTPTPSSPKEKVSPRPGPQVSPRGPAPGAPPTLQASLPAPKLEAAWIRRPSPQKAPTAERHESPLSPTPAAAPESKPAPALSVVPKGGSKLGGVMGIGRAPAPPVEVLTPVVVTPVVPVVTSIAPITRPVAKNSSPVAIGAKSGAALGAARISPTTAPAATASPNSAAAFLAAVETGNPMLSRTSGQGPIVRKETPTVAVVPPAAAATPAPTAAAPGTGKAAFAASLGAKLAVGGPPPKATTPASDSGANGPVSKINLTPIDTEDFQNANNAGQAPAPRLPSKPPGPQNRKPPTRNIVADD